MKMIAKKHKPKKFKVMNLGFMKSVKDRWRRPRGVDNKKRIRKRSAGPSPRIGYKNSGEVRFLHPSGLKEVLVHNVAELIAAGNNVAVRIAGGVGGRKKAEIEKKAGELKLRVINSEAKKAQQTKQVAGKPAGNGAGKPSAARSAQPNEAKLSSPKTVKVEKPAKSAAAAGNKPQAGNSSKGE